MILTVYTNTTYIELPGIKTPDEAARAILSWEAMGYTVDVTEARAK